MAAFVRAMGSARLAFLVSAWLFVVCVLVQVLLVGLDVFARFESATHRDFAYVYGWLAPLMVLLGGAARMPAGIRWLTALLVVVFAIQTVMPSLRDELPLLAALHPVNALLIFALGIVIARRASDLVRQPSSPFAER